MVYSDTTNKNGILQKCEFYVFGSNYGAITDNTTRKAEFNGLINDSLDSIVSDILDSDTRWQWDDTNRTDFPIGQKLSRRTKRLHIRCRTFKDTKSRGERRIR